MKEKENFDGIFKQAHEEKNAEPYTWSHIRENLIWNNIIHVLVLHVGFLMAVVYYAHKIWLNDFKYMTLVWLVVMVHVTTIGVGGGVHRFWSHRSFKAKWPLRLILMLLYSTAGMNSIFDWVRDHKIHHRYSETDADPHNARRGFFFSHVGWLLMRKHPECIRRGRELDMSDLTADPIVMFNKKYAFELKLVMCFLVPISVPVLFWGESLLIAAITQGLIRYVYCLNGVWCVNSVAHLWGDRPYNRLINPAENTMVSILTAGEGAHNYHHTFPWDYKSSEMSGYLLNCTTLVIDAFAAIGWAYDLKQPSPELIDKVVKRIGHKSKTISANISTENS